LAVHDPHAAAAGIAHLSQVLPEHRFRLPCSGIVQVEFVLDRVVAAGEAPEHARADLVAAVAQGVAGLQRPGLQQSLELAAGLAVVALGHARARRRARPAGRLLHVRQPPNRADRVPEQRAVVVGSRVPVVAPAHAVQITRAGPAGRVHPLPCRPDSWHGAARKATCGYWSATTTAWTRRASGSSPKVCAKPAMKS